MLLKDQIVFWRSLCIVLIIFFSLLYLLFLYNNRDCIHKREIFTNCSRLCYDNNYLPKAFEIECLCESVKKEKIYIGGWHESFR